MRRVVLRVALLLWASSSPCPTQARVLTAFPPQGIGPTVLASEPGDTVLVSPGIYGPESGVQIVHDLTIIGEGGAGLNEVRVCASASCPLYLFQVRPGVDATIEGLTITKWDAGAIGVTLSGNANAAIRRCVFHDLGAGIFGNGGNIDLQESVFYGHQAGSLYGVWLRFSSGNIQGNTFTSMRHAIRLEEGASPTIQRNIVAQNTGQGVACLTGSAPEFQCNDAWANAQGNYLGCPDPTGGDGNISADPLFCDLAEPYFRLQPDSPCLPGHSPPTCGLIGALGPCSPSTSVPDAGSAALELTITPNPFRQKTRIGFKDGLRDPILEIYNPQGQMVEVVRAKASPHDWQPNESTPPGVYFVRLRAEGASTVVKFVLLPR